MIKIILHLVKKRIIKNKIEKNNNAYELHIDNLNNSLIIKARENECLGLRFIAVQDPLNTLSSLHLDKIEQYMNNFSSFLSLLSDNVTIMYIKISESYTDLLRRIESKMNKLRVLLELGGNDVKKLRELKVLEKIHDNLLNSKNVYRIILLFIVKVIGKCDVVENILEKETSNLMELIDTYLSLKPYIVNPKNIIDYKTVIPVMDRKIVVDKRKSILIIGNNGGALLPISRNESNVIDVDLEGVYIGYDMVLGKPIMLSPEKHLKYHGLVIGPTGKGKTTLLASMFYRAHLLGYSVAAIDFKGDMTRYVADDSLIVYGIDFKSLLKSYRNKGFDINKWVFDVARMLSSIFGLKRAESYIIFRVVQQVIFGNKDLYSVERELSKNKYFSRIGSRSDVYGHIIEAINALIDDEAKHDMLLRELKKTYIINLEHYPDYIKELLSSIVLLYEKNMSTPLSKFKKLVLVDEAWRLRNINPNALSMLYREGRSLGIGVFSTSQLLRDLSKTIVDNSSVFVIFGSNTKEYINDIKESFNLTSRELEKISELGVGEAAIIIKGSKRPIWVKIVPEK